MELEDVLRDEEGLQCFKEFLKKEFSYENLEFWLRCNEFKKMNTKKDMKKCCEQIYNKYISLKGSHSVNIDHQARKMIEDFLKKPHKNMFDMAMHQIFQLMQSDSFVRFRTLPAFIKISKSKAPVNFTMHFPEGYLITVEALPNKSAYITVKSILARLGITWQDVELHNDNGHPLNSSLLVDPNFELDHCNIYVSYLSSLRTYIKLEDINDLNEDGINIRSIQFAEYNRQKPSSSQTVQANSLPRSCSSFVIEMPHFAQVRPTKRVAEEINADHHLYANETRNIDINDLSFSNESATDDFLADIMTSDISKLNFICTPQKKRKQKESVERIAENIYANVPSANESHYSVPKKENTPVHKARFVIIDENEYQNVMDSQNRDLCMKEDISSCKKPPSAATKLVFDERFCDCRHSANVSKNQVPNLNAIDSVKSRPLRRLSQMPYSLQPPNKALNISSPISFKKYLLPSTNTPEASLPNINNNCALLTTNRAPANRISLTANNNFSNFCITPLKSNTPDLIATTGGSSCSKKSRMHTLARFHKVI